VPATAALPLVSSAASAVTQQLVASSGEAKIPATAASPAPNCDSDRGLLPGRYRRPARPMTPTPCEVSAKTICWPSEDDYARVFDRDAASFAQAVTPDVAELIQAADAHRGEIVAGRFGGRVGPHVLMSEDRVWQVGEHERMLVRHEPKRQTADPQVSGGAGHVDTRQHTSASQLALARMSDRQRALAEQRLRAPRRGPGRLPKPNPASS
jgi:hypothetical protein